MSSAGVAALALLAASAGGAPTLSVRVQGSAVRRSTAGCLFSIRAPVVGGGRQLTCLTSVRGYPSAGAIVRSRGRMTFVLPRGTVRTRVAIVQRFGPDGAHARQALSGTVVGGSGRYAGARGTVRGGGSVVDTRSALRGLRLSYRLVLER